MKKFIHVGCGNWGNTWLNRIIPQISDIAQCVAVVDINLEAVNRFGEKLGLPESARYVSFEAALKEHDVDFVTIATSASSHRVVVNTAVDFGKGCAIVMEKPIADTMEDCAAIYHKVKNAGVKLSVTFSHRYEDDKQTFENILRSGMAGNINYIISRIMLRRREGRNMTSTVPGSHLIGGGIHNMDMIRGFTGSDVDEVYALGWDFPWANNKGTAPCALVHMTMQNGVKVYQEFQMAGPYEYNGWTKEYFRAECDNASYELDNRRIMARCSDGYPNPVIREVPLMVQDHWKHDLIIRKTLDWAEGGPEPDISLNQAIKSMGMVFAAVESCSTGKPVKVADIMHRYGLEY